LAKGKRSCPQISASQGPNVLGLPWSVYFGALRVNQYTLQRIIEIDIDPGCRNVMLMSQLVKGIKNCLRMLLELIFGLVCQAAPNDQKVTKISRSRTAGLSKSTYAVVGEIKSKTLRLNKQLDAPEGFTLATYLV
jgi:hypothetical protein